MNSEEVRALVRPDSEQPAGDVDETTAFDDMQNTKQRLYCTAVTLGLSAGEPQALKSLLNEHHLTVGLSDQRMDGMKLRQHLGRQNAEAFSY